VIPNKYPAIQASNGIPAHEVVIDIPDHDLAFEDLGQERLESAISVWQRRAGVQAALPARRFGCVFRNEGRGSGQSIAHPHSQIVALDHVPERIRRELEGFSSRPCPLCALIENECRSGKRMIDHSGSLVLIAPPASKAPFETWITSARHQAGWTEANPGQMAELLLSAVQRLRSVHPGAPFNLGLVTRPLRTEGAERFHWYAEVTPRLTNLAGFEMLTGEWINIESPERAAERLREALPLRRD
jgi:UDPglucose--hexose-1-phosphate uridylyltransferase